MTNSPSEIESEVRTVTNSGGQNHHHHHRHLNPMEVILRRFGTTTSSIANSSSSSSRSGSRDFEGGRTGMAARSFSSSSTGDEGYGSIHQSGGYDDEVGGDSFSSGRRRTTTTGCDPFNQLGQRRFLVAAAVFTTTAIIVLIGIVGFTGVVKDSASTISTASSTGSAPTQRRIRPHFTPTLLQVVDTMSAGSDTGNTDTDTHNDDEFIYVYALNNTLYNEMLDPTTRYMDVSEIGNDDNEQRSITMMANNELPQLMLDKTTLDMREIVSTTSGGKNDGMRKAAPSLKVTWTVGRDTTNGQIVVKEDDIIALYCGGRKSFNVDGSSKDGQHLTDEEGRKFLEAATIAQARITSKHHGGHEDSWFLPTFPILRQPVCQFYLYTHLSGESTNNKNHDNGLTLIRIATSDPITILHAEETPSAIHLALHEDPTKMVVQFTTGMFAADQQQPQKQKHLVPVVRYYPASGANHDDLQQQKTKIVSSSATTKETTVKLSYGTSDTYTADDMCQSPANKTEAGKFYSPGSLHKVTMTDLDPSTTYNYQVGLIRKEKTSTDHYRDDDILFDENDVLLWSDLYHFESAPVTESDRDGQKPFSYVVYGDQGCPANRHCSDGKEWIRKILHHGRHGVPLAVHHFGDISYANGASHVWDEWFQMISPISTSIPIMISIGNHEYDHTGGGIGKDLSGTTTPDGYHPEWGNFMGESQGECGTPMAKRFKMPESKLSNGVFWYSYDFASVHTVVISSEHDLSRGSVQFDFLLHDLKNVDRSVTPWVILETHRPLYEGETGNQWISNTRVGEAMRLAIEDLLYDYDVDIVLGGHYHEYHRTCDRLYKGVCNSPSGPMHITVGSAGAPLDDFYDAAYNQTWTGKYLRGVFGYGKINVVNDTALRFEFISYDDNDEVLDEVWIVRDR